MRTQATSTGYGNVSCTFHGVACANAYWGGVSYSSGNIWIGRTRNGGALTLASGSLGRVLAFGEEIVLEVGITGDQLELRLRSPDEERPAGPLLTATNTELTHGVAGVYYEPTQAGAEGVFDWVLISNQQSPQAIFEVTPETGTAPLEISVDGSGSIPQEGQSIVSYRWDFGDGTVIDGEATASHTYQSGGAYVIELTVTDDRGMAGSGRRGITLNCPQEDVDPWASADIGEPDWSGSAWFEGEGDEEELHVCAAGGPVA